MTIPARNIVQVNPGVISAGGSALNLNGVILTTDPSIPMGTVQSFASATAVGNWFGSASTEKSLADVYFGGFNNATVLPAALLFAQYNSAAVGGYLRSGSWSSLTLADVQALNGTLTITFAGSALTSGTIDLSTATSFSNAATIIQAAFTSPGFTVTYDSQRQAFLFESTATGATETITYATGTIAAGLLLTQATGAVLSQGAAAATPSGIMDQVYAATLNWGGFMTAFEPIDSDKLLFASWNNSKLNRFLYAAWDTNAVPAGATDTSSFMYNVLQAGYSGTTALYNDVKHAAFVLGAMASTDFGRTNGRFNYAFRYLSGLTASVTDETIAANLQAHSYNFIGSYATANDSFTFLYPGSVSGDFAWLDSYINQIYLNSQLQLALMTLITNVNSIPYNQSGYGLIRAACQDPIDQAVNFGSISGGVSLSASQIAQVNNAAGKTIDTVLSQRGWYLQIQDATAQVRGQRGSPPITLWYMDGGSVQKITVASIVVL